jgi:hypothetical protein
MEKQSFWFENDNTNTPKVKPLTFIYQAIKPFVKEIFFEGDY